jgi:hypothetical protein
VSNVETFLDDLFDRLAGTGHNGRRALAEAEDHLRQATASGVAAGLDPTAAEQAAITRFGTPASLAAGIRAVHSGPSRWLRPAFVGLWLAGGIGLIAVGLSGGVAELLGRWRGPSFVAGDAPGVTYTGQRCAEYLALFPGAGTCTDAAALDHWGEVVQSRVAAGILGVLALFALWLARRSTRLGGPAWTPPAAAVAIPLAVAFALAGVGLGGIGAMELAFGTNSMVGANLAAGLVGILAAIATALWVGWKLAHNPERPLSAPR